MMQKLLKLFNSTLKPLKNSIKNYIKYKKRLNDEKLYNIWANQNEEKCFIDPKTELANNKTLFSIIVPLYNTPTNHLYEMVYSVINQHYENWELVLANGSDKNFDSTSINKLSEIDRRIKVINCGGNLGISGNTNVALNNSIGDYIVFFDHDDLIHPCALHVFYHEIISNNADLIYSDEDKISDDGKKFFNSFFKPTWSLLLFENVNYLNHLTAIKSTIVKKVGNFNENYDGAQDYDFYLRVIDQDKDINIIHVPRILYHWRAAKSSTAKSINTKTYVLDAGTKALNDHMKRLGMNGEVKAINSRPGFYKTIYKPSQEKISVIIGGVSIVTRPFVENWIKKLINNNPQIIKEIFIGEWFIGDKIFNGVEIRQYKETIPKIKPNANYILVINELFDIKPGLAAIEELLSLVVARQKSAVPILLNGGEMINSFYIRVSGIDRQIYQDKKFGSSDEFGSSEWVREVDSSTDHMALLTLEDFKNIKNCKIISPKNGLIVWPHLHLNSLGSLDTDYVENQINNYYLDSTNIVKNGFKGLV